MPDPAECPLPFRVGPKNARYLSWVLQALLLTVLGSCLAARPSLGQWAIILALFAALLVILSFPVLSRLLPSVAGAIGILAAQAGAGLLLAHLTAGHAFFILLFFPPLAQTVLWLPRLPAALMQLGIAGAALASFYLPWTGGGHAQFWNVVSFAVGLAFAAQWAYYFKALLRQQWRTEQLLEQLTHAHAQAQELAAARERERLAREIHDTVAHGLTALLFQLEGALRRHAQDREDAGTMVARAAELARSTLGEVRRAVRALQPEDPVPDTTAFRRLAEDFGEDTGLAVDFLTDGDEAWPSPEGRLALFRAFQEALTNSRRHSGAQKVRASLIFGPGEVCLQVKDDGQGVAAVREGFGLSAMRRRAQELGGRCEFSSAPGRGFRLDFVLPREAS